MGFLEDTATAIATTIRANMPASVTVQAYDPGGFGFATPLIAVGLPDLDFTRYDEPETQLGFTDWHAQWPVTLYVTYRDPKNDPTTAMDLTRRVVEAFHLDPTCDGQVEDAAVTSARSGFNDTQKTHRLIVVEFDVATYAPLPT